MQQANAPGLDAHSAVKDVNEAFRGGARALGFLGQINKASIVMLAEIGLVQRGTASAIAKGVLALDEGAEAEQSSGDYLDYEKRLIRVVGSQASVIHTGRSRQDIASTMARMNLRDDVLNAHRALVDARMSVIALAARHGETIIPAYTHGVQAQPTTLAHYLLSLSCALGRQLDRLQESWKRLNLSSFGAAALSTSSFPLDRVRLAELLGFDGLVENAYDANHWAPVDICVEFAGVLALCAVQIGQFAQDLHAQYASPTPWATLEPGELIGISSLMPQKRNPAALEQLRAQSSLLIAEMMGPMLLAHNVRTGMFDYRSYDPLPTARPVNIFQLLKKVVDGLVIHPHHARAEIDADYSTVTEVADALMQVAGIPFRDGHEFASLVTDFGRGAGKPLVSVSHAEASKLYEEHFGKGFPLDQDVWKRCSDASAMVFNRKGRGGPQRPEVARLQGLEEASNEAAMRWNLTVRDRLASAHEALLIATRELAKG